MTTINVSMNDYDYENMIELSDDELTTVTGADAGGFGGIAAATIPMVLAVPAAAPPAAGPSVFASTNEASHSFHYSLHYGHSATCSNSTFALIN
jgi:hypothetical protein